MSQVIDALGFARSGRGHVVAVGDEPGVGKSRLFWEFAHSHHAECCIVIEATSVSFVRPSGAFSALVRKP
jgi:predicted ATP-dependent serine protease